jgi:signal transduction histidine kinase
LSLTTRLSIAFLLMLALVEIIFAAGLYWMAREHMMREANARVTTAITILSGLVEKGPEGLEWEGDKRSWSLDSPLLQDELFWLVTDSHGDLVDRSRSPMLTERMSDRMQMLDENVVPRLVASESLQWLAARRQIDADVVGAGQFAAVARETSEEDGEQHIFYSSLNVSAALSTQRIMADLQRLATALIGLSLIIWTLALGVSRSVCRRGLAPLQAMVHAAKDIDVRSLANRRLPCSSTGDELSEMANVFNAVLDRLQESFEKQRSFTGDASHQLRTPLTALIGQIEVALRRERQPEEYRAILAKSHDRALHLSRIVEALLFVARTHRFDHLARAKPGALD